VSPLKKRNVRRRGQFVKGSALANAHIGFHTRAMRYLLMLSLLFILPVWTQAEGNQPKGMRISLSAMAETDLANDEVAVQFRVQAEGRRSAPLRQQVNRISARIKQRLENESNVKLTTTSRRLEPVWEYHAATRKRERTGWRMVQTGTITSTKLDAVPNWLDDIEQAGAQLSGLQFRVSSPTMNDAQDALQLQAIRKFRHKAGDIAKGLDTKSFRVIRLQTNASRPIYPVRGMAMMASKADAAPALSSGESKVSVTVSGEIEVPFRDFPVR